MSAPLLHPRAESLVAQFVARPPHAVLLIAPNGGGKGTVARYMASKLLGVPAGKLESNAYFKQIAAPAGKMISIEEVRGVTHFLMLKSAKRAEGTTRVVLIEHAGDLTTQAQNALLKMTEEPPEGTVLILTASHELDVLPTIRSRAQIMTLQLPTAEALHAHFQAAGFTESALSRALLMSGGLPGLTEALLARDQNHPLVAATTRARAVLQASSLDRLIMIDDLAKNKQEWIDTLFILERMAQINLEKPNADALILKKWLTVLKAASAAGSQTRASAQTKLVALNFMLGL